MVPVPSGFLCPRGGASTLSASLLKALWLSYLSQPANDRLIYRTVRKLKVRKILEVGIGDGQRALNLISLAQRYQPETKIHYVGIDLFESRPADAALGLPLKEAFCRLRAAGARTNLVPGDPNEAIASVANSLPGFELVLFTADRPLESYGRAWFFLPRMLSSGATVLIAESAILAPGEPPGRSPAVQSVGWRSMTLAEIHSLAVAPWRKAA